MTTPHAEGQKNPRSAPELSPVGQRDGLRAPQAESAPMRWLVSADIDEAYALLPPERQCDIGWQRGLIEHLSRKVAIGCVQGEKGSLSALMTYVKQESNSPFWAEISSDPTNNVWKIGILQIGKHNDRSAEGFYSVLRKLQSLASSKRIIAQAPISDTTMQSDLVDLGFTVLGGVLGEVKVELLRGGNLARVRSSIVCSPAHPASEARETLACVMDPQYPAATTTDRSPFSILIEFHRESGCFGSALVRPSSEALVIEQLSLDADLFSEQESGYSLVRGLIAELARHAEYFGLKTLSCRWSEMDTQLSVALEAAGFISHRPYIFGAHSAPSRQGEPLALFSASLVTRDDSDTAPSWHSFARMACKESIGDINPNALSLDAALADIPCPADAKVLVLSVGEEVVGLFPFISRGKTAEWVCRGTMKRDSSAYLKTACAAALTECFARLGIDELKVNVLPGLNPLNQREMFFMEM